MMEDPAPQALMFEDSILNASRCSSPFVSEIENRSRNPSKQFSTSFDAPKTPEHVGDCQRADKENEPLGRDDLFCKSTYIQPGNSIQTTMDSELMPPPTSTTPRRSPLRALQHISPSRPSSQDGSFGILQMAATQRQLDSHARQDSTAIDDTCFSNFSEIPDLTQLTKTTQSASKRVDALLSRSPRHSDLGTSRTSRKRSSPSRSPSPTPRRMRTPNASKDNTQSFLIDFTQQIEDLGPPGRLPTSRTAPNLLQHMNRQRSPHKTYRQSLATPAKQSNILNLLDFELPPAPTPRSIPTITVRELETLKSQYLSQISGLKATLSGREAEVESLKRAIGDAERRVGDAQQASKEETSRREHAEQERTDWERRGLEVENVLKNVREEVLKSETEREELMQKMDEYERRIDEAELKASKAEEGISEALALRNAAENGADVAKLEEQVQRLVASQIDAKIEAVSRELHAVYKEKHERKVATLKKSYEARSEKRCAEIQSRVEQLEQANDELLLAKQVTQSPTRTTSSGEEARLKTQLEEHKAHLARLEEELTTSRAQQEGLMCALEQERIEKGDLVAAVDEMLLLQTEQGPTQGAMSVVEDFRKSISRPPSAMSTGLRRPSESRIGKMPSLSRTPAGSKSKMLANIERMGRSAVHD